MDFLIWFLASKNQNEVYNFINETKNDDNFLNNFYIKYPLNETIMNIFYDVCEEKQYEVDDNIYERDSDDIFDMKSYINDISILEHLNTKELKEITRKSAPVISRWQNPDDPTIPRRNELVIISQRLGITIDDIYDNNYNLLFYNKIEDCTYIDYVNNKYNPACVAEIDLKILNDNNCSLLLNNYLKNLKIFNNYISDYLKSGVIHDDFDDLSKNKLFAHYRSDDDPDELSMFDMQYLVSFKLLTSEEELSNKPEFFPLMADLVMLNYYPKEPDLVIKYLKELKRIDEFHSYYKKYKNYCIDSFFDLYDKLYIRGNELKDNSNKLLKEILKSGASLHNEKRLYEIMLKLI